MVYDGKDGPSRRDPARRHDAGANPTAAGAGSVRLPASSVEPVYGLSPDVPVITQHGTALKPGRSRLPVRVPGQLLHPLLRRSSWDGRCGRAGSSV
ncbi:MAG: hypothetical protein ACRDR6_30910 [Pseudonocardiaceae bacterium]